ncbi:hypothetical protein CKAN_00399900 [Cinnamomum micranthum f. kanehirae]|uniref:Uncharacterized protein n=1 Tax=Cinnamomum micranthum f. kanehirae TaxID=337451 RepID=A0A443NAR7_9MAGN|nr:hypothetical protein CKAN_00399900 [Cinnamomum micranthum f. kanehirae]
MEKQQSPVHSTSEERRQATGDANPGNEGQEQCMDCDRDHINAYDLLSKLLKARVFVGTPNQSASWAFYRRFLLFAIELLLSVLRLGFFQVSDLKKKKQKHTYAGQVMEILVFYATDADSGSNPPTFDTNLMDPTRLPDLDPKPPQSSQGTLSSNKCHLPLLLKSISSN